MVSLQNLDENHIRVPCVLHVVRHRLRDVPTITRMIIKRTCISLRSIDPDPRLASDEEIPLGTRCMPVDFSQRTGLDCDDCCREGACDGEDGGINDFDASAGCYVVRIFFGEMEGVGLFEWNNTC